MSDRLLRAAALGVALAGAALAAYLLAVRWGHAELVCRTSGCETVQASRYASVLGIPVAALGLAAYVAIAILTQLASPLARAAAASIALAGAAFSAYLLIVQLVVIGEVCHWCLVNDALVSVLAVVTLLAARASLTRSP